MSEKNLRTIVLPTIPPSGGNGRKTRLLVTAGPLEGREYIITKFPYTIGSGLSNDLSVADPTISRHHCEICLTDEEGLIIRDLGSTNGTGVGGIKVTSARLAPNTEIQLGHTRIIVPLQQDHPELTMSAREQFGNSIGRTPLMRHVFHLAEHAAACDSPVLILGETGTGKEELAEDIHHESARRDAPFIVIDCNSFADAAYAKREIFGEGDLPGALTLATGGTLFIDSVDRLPADVQPLLLRALESRHDIRFIFASKQNLPKLAHDGIFSKPLYCVLAIIVIEMPALRRRRDDLPLLLRSLTDRLHSKEDVRAWCDQPATLAFLRRYNWPGNIRELRTLIEKLNALDRIPADIASFLQETVPEEPSVEEEKSESFVVSADRPFKDLKNELIEDFERRYLTDLLSRNAQNISQSARNAGIERAYLQRLIRKYGMRNAD